MANREQEILKSNWMSFSISPVQGFIEASRTVRDLWSGSYLLSWLTARAMATALDGGAELATPAFARNPLVKLAQTGKTDGEKRQYLGSCLPNTFTATLDASAEDAEKLTEEIKKSVEEEWLRIADAVYNLLGKKWGDPETWNPFDGWKTQVENYWEIRTAVLPVGTDLEAAAGPLKIVYTEGSTVERDVYLAREILGRLGAAQKMIRHIPPSANQADTRPKCFLLGTDARMGPVPVKDNTKFWEKTGSEKNIKGERLQPRDRLGAVALAKRFAWAAYLSGKVGCASRKKRTWDTATIAAAGWIRGLGKDGTQEYIHERLDNTPDPWSGQWLHWKERDPWAGRADTSSKDDDACPEEVWNQIQETKEDAKKNRGLKAPPPYYALLMLDGDGMGDFFRGASQKNAEEASGALQDFALKIVPDKIREYLGGESGIDIGQPIYAGGDDVMAMLPLWMLNENSSADKEKGLPIEQTVLQCAQAINTAFAEQMKPYMKNGDAHTSAGLVIAHYKENLREVLEEARRAEKVAKDAGKDCLAISAMRRSGEHSCCVVSWSNVERIDKLIKKFIAGSISDRWAYQLKAELDRETLTTKAMIDVEVARLLSRSEKGKDEELPSIWQDLMKGSSGTDLEKAVNAIELVMTASFMARGREN